MASARNLIQALIALGEEGYSFLVVPGGGPMADLVREIHSRAGLSQEAAHWMAILAMEQYGYFLADGTGAALTREVHRPIKGCPVQILLPYQALCQDDRGLEHNWDYTSDSVAALISWELRAPLIKATNVDGVLLQDGLAEELSACDLLGMESCIDQGTIRLLCSRLEDSCIWVLNGTDAQRFVDFLKKREGGTIIKGERKKRAMGRFIQRDTSNRKEIT